MSLQTQIYLHSCDTSCFYDENERLIHNRLVRLYSLRKKISDIDKPKKKKLNKQKDKKTYQTKKTSERKEWEKSLEGRLDWRIKSINRLLKKEKARLSELLDDAVKRDVLRELNPAAVTDKTVVNLFESDLTRSLGLEPFKLTDELFIVNVFFFQVFNNLVHRGFIYNGEKYTFLTASAGQIRQKRAVFVKESSFKRIEQKLMCGLTIDEINQRGGMNGNKFLAYLALMNSATDVWEDFDIDKSIVVDDWETAVPGLVDHIDGVSYEIEREMTETVIPHMDGCGIQRSGTTRMCRLPWIKGLMVTFPFDKFIKERCNGCAKVTDIYGVEHDIIGEDIQYIFTKSQFKLH